MSEKIDLAYWLRSWRRICKRSIVTYGGCVKCVKTDFSQSMPECKEAARQIMALIEHGPEVTRGFVVNSARAMGAAPDALAMVLEEAGVRVKEGK